MKVLYFSRDYSPHDHRFLDALGQTGLQVCFLRLERRGHALEERPLPAGVEPVRWLGGRRPVRLTDFPHLSASLRHVIRRVKPDLIQAGPIQSAAFLTAWAGFHPLVSVSWGSDLLRDAERSLWHRWATRFTLRRSDVMVGDCRPVRQKAAAFGMPDARIVTFPWGVDLDHFSPGVPAAADPSRKPAFTLLSTRSWEPLLGVEVIARAFVQASRRLAARRGPELRLIMLGSGSQAGLIRQILGEAGVLAQVEFPGQVGRQELPHYYRRADLYVSASHSDGSSISLLEALACARPALVSDIPGNREWVEPGVHGWWFPDGDVEALTGGILAAVEQRRQLAQMGQAARVLAEQRADWQANFQQLLAAYQLALGGV